MSFEEETPAVFETLASPNPAQRVAALKQMSRMGEPGAIYYGTAEMASGMIGDSDPKVTAAALSSLGDMGAAAGSYSEVIAAQVDSQHKEVKIAAMKALGKIGAMESASVIERHLTGRDMDLVAAACVALGTMKSTKSAGQLVSAMKNYGDVEVMVSAIEGLGAMGEEATALSKMMDHQDARVKAAACTALLFSAEQFAGKAVKLLSDSDVYVRNSAMYLIATAGSKAAGEASAVGRLLSHSDVGVCVAAALAIGSMGEGAISQAEELAKLLTHAGEDTASLPHSIAGIKERYPAAQRKPACAAAEALAAIGAKDKLPAIVAHLNDADWEVKAACAAAVGKFGAPGAKYEENLMILLDDAQPMVVKEACMALGLVAKETSGNPAAAEKVAECLKLKHPGVKGAALKALGCMKEESSAYIEDIVKAMDDPVGYVRCCAVEAVSGAGETGQMFAGKVARLMYDNQPRVAMAALVALKDMGGRGAGFAEEVAMMLGNAEPEVRKEAVLALISFGSESYPYLDAIQDLGDNDPFDVVRDAAAGAKDQIREPLPLTNKAGGEGE